MKCLLCDINPAMREAWEKSWSGGPGWRLLCSVVAGGITDLRVDAVVSPANSIWVLCAAEWTASIPAFSGKRGKPVAGNHPYASRGGTAGRGSSHRAYRTYGHPVADLRARPCAGLPCFMTAIP